MTKPAPFLSNPERQLMFVLRAVAILDLAAILAVFLPVDWMDVAHRWTGLGPLPKVPIVDYLARSASALYALFGMLTYYVSTDIRRYRRLIRIMVYGGLAHGCIVVGVDFHAGIPRIWTLIEAVGHFAPAIAVLWLLDQIKFEQQQR
jgi:hypothetical protein